MNIDKGFIEKAKNTEKRKKMIKDFAFSRVVVLSWTIFFTILYMLPKHNEYELTMLLFSVVALLVVDYRVKTLKLFDELMSEK